jgi:apolipoprotein D and lipocalin family protein
MRINENLLKRTRTQAGLLFWNNDLGRLLRHSGFLLLCMLFLPWSVCYAQPAGATAVSNFSLQRYLGTWYEIARLDHRFERGLSQVTANYSMREDGGVRVLNRGYSEKKSRWKDAEGKAYFVDGADTGRLKVSFFGPFYGAYNIIALDHENYSYALVVGNNLKYLWILAREPRLEPAVMESLLNKARALGFATDQLIYPYESDLNQETTAGATK